MVVRLAGGRAKDTKGECRGRRQIAYSDTVTTKLKIRTYMVVDERGCTPPARDVATGTFHHLIYQVNSSSCDCFREDHDAAFILAGVSEGFDWEKVAPTSEHDTPNCVPAELEERVNDRVEAMLASGEIIAVERHDVHTISPLMVVDKDHSNFEKFRLIHNLSAPKGDRPTRAFKLDVAETYRLGTEHPH